DSILLQVGTVASRDIFWRFIKKDASDKHMVWVSRILILAFGVIGILVALIQPPGVFAIVIFTTSVLGSAFMPAYICAVWWKKANIPGAIASMIGGAATAFFWELLGINDKTGFHEMLVGLVVSFILMIVVSKATQKSHPVSEEILNAMDEAHRVGPIPPDMLAAAEANLAAEAGAISTKLNK
ncbi:MAG: sodium:solute symporter family transporter, partial [Sediminispirochaetaceae bacterium]